MNLPSNNESNFYVEPRLSKTLKRSAYSKVILNTKSAQNVNQMEIDIPKKSEISLAQTKNFSSSLVSENYNSVPTYQSKLQNPNNKDSYSNNNINSPPFEEVKTFTQNLGRSTHFASRSIHTNALSTTSDDRISNINSETKSNIFVSNRLTTFRKPIKKRKNVKNPLTHVPYNECQTDNSLENIDFNNTQSVDINDNFLKTNDSVKLDEKLDNEKNENEKDEEEEKVEKERVLYNPPEGGNESGANNFDFDSIKLVYQNHEEGADLLEKPIIKRKILEENVISFGIIPFKLNMKNVIQLIDEIREKEKPKKQTNFNPEKGNETGAKGKKEISGRKLRDRNSKDKYLMDEINYLDESTSKGKRNTKDGNLSYDEERIKCLANQRCSII